MQTLALKLLDTTDRVCNRRLKNPIAKMFWNKVGRKHGEDQIMASTDEELKKDLNELFTDFKEFFENKQMKNMVNEGNQMSGIKLEDLISNQKLQRVSKYF